MGRPGSAELTGMPGRAAVVRSLAKINLDLRVLYKRPDGFHELRTLFQTVSLGDTIGIAFTPGRRTQIRLVSELEIPEKDNLIVRAAEAVMEAAGARGEARFSLTKRIPMGGGLGGGSSNAAAVLLALPVLAGKTLAMDKLIGLAGDLGSDVPFFLLGGAAFGFGRGAELYPAPAPSADAALLVTPGVHVSTAEAYRGLNRSQEMNQSANFPAFAWALEEKSGWHPVNDFESSVFALHPRLKTIKRKLLQQGACSALMSGSGSTLFGIFKEREKRDRAAESLAAELGAGHVHPVALVSRARYRSLWRRQLGEHAVEGTEWPPRSRYVR